MRQYEIRWAQLGPPIGRRPVLLLTRTPACSYLNKVVVAEITTTIRGIPQEVLLGAREGLKGRCAANLDNIHLVSKDVLDEPVGVLGLHRQREVKRSLGYVFGWDELKVL